MKVFFQRKLNYEVAIHRGFFYKEHIFHTYKILSIKMFALNVQCLTLFKFSSCASWSLVFASA